MRSAEHPIPGGDPDSAVCRQAVLPLPRLHGGLRLPAVPTIDTSADLLLDLTDRRAVLCPVARVGTGCLLGALTAACTSVWEDSFEAALAATTWMALAGERAASRATGPGSFRMHLLDALNEIGRRP